MLRRSKKRDYDRENTEAAEIILSNPQDHTDFCFDWARRFRDRVARERSKRTGQRMLPLGTAASVNGCRM